MSRADDALLALRSELVAAIVAGIPEEWRSEFADDWTSELTTAVHLATADWSVRMFKDPASFAAFIPRRS